MLYDSCLREQTAKFKMQKSRPVRTKIIIEQVENSSKSALLSCKAQTIGKLWRVISIFCQYDAL